VRNFPDAQLLLAGNGPQKENLQQEIVRCGLQKNVRMLGYCICLEKYQRVADVVVACSRREGLPLNIVEAMLTGNPVVASINRGHRELLKDGRTGYLVNSASEMTERIEKLFSDTDLHDRIGNEARIYAQNYAFSNVKKELEAVYFERK
jgi:glycosyltransferase EpsD